MPRSPRSPRSPFGLTIALVTLNSMLFILACSTVGCSSSGESAQRDTLTADVGKYPPPPAGISKPRVGVPPFKVTGTGAVASGDANELAADQMTTLLEQSERFTMIERAQLTKLLDEQNLEGIVKPGELARPGQVRGVDYLLVGKVTNLRVKKDTKQHELGLARVGNLFGGGDIKKKDIVLTTECGVDIRLVNPTTGEIMMTSSTEYKRMDTAGAMGVDILGANASSDADIQVDEDDKGKILRLALDDALKKALPKIDSFLVSHPAKAMGGDASMPMTHEGPAPAGASGAVATKKFCSQCGKEIAGDTKFCPHCGAKVGG